MHSPSLNEREREIRRRLKDDFEHYASRCLWIRPKKGPLVRFSLNKAQRYIHERLEEQRRQIGRVRALILKGRQQGCSTYVGGRFYHRVSHSKGLKVFILTHEEQATLNLFEMVGRYHENCPELVRPSTGAANAKELKFDRLDSAYKVGTAGNKGAGRSLTAQLFHGSEVAFWPNAESHAAGVLQAVPNEEGTEVILESTANGVGNYYHRMWQEAERGENGFIAIFVPWYWQDEYREEPPADFELSPDEDEQGESEVSYADAYGLDHAQMYWRRIKIRQLGASLFRQEYPATAAEAFQMSGHDSFISAPLVVKARKFSAEPSGPLIMGYDPAWKTGTDRSSMALRRGRKLLSVENRTGLDTMQSVGWIKGVIDSQGVKRCFIDVTGLGAGVYDRLCEMGYGDGGRGIVLPVNFGGSPLEPQRFDPATGEELPGPLNRRAEIWLNSRDWLESPAGVDIPDSDELQADACGPGYSYDSRTRLIIEPKEKMRGRGVRSPDGWDAVALTFGEPVIDQEPRERRRKRRGGSSGWMGA
jgi:hypothetical protein